MFSSCEIETIDGCKYCEINYEIMNTSSLTLNDLNELAIEKGCKQFPGRKALKKKDKTLYKSQCRAIREDGT